MKSTETTSTPPADIELHFVRDLDSKTTGYLVVIPDSRLEGMSGPNLKEIIPSLWNSSRTKGQRVALLASAIVQIEAYRPLGGPPPVVPKPTRRERLARWLNNFRRAKK